MAPTLALPIDLECTPAVDEACKRIAPLWPLQNFVAVNPFLGFDDVPFEKAALQFERAGADILMAPDYYLAAIRSGAISDSNIRAALARSGFGVAVTDAVSWLESQLRAKDQGRELLTVADCLDSVHGSDWSRFIVDEISKWCSSYFDRGQSSWEMPGRSLGLYRAWKQAAEMDANPEVFGLRGFRGYVRDLPDSEDHAIAHALSLLDIPPPAIADFLHRQLMSVPGWSAYAAYQDRQGPGAGNLRQLLAIRLAYDAALLSRCANWRFETHKILPASRRARHLAQLALEDAYCSNLWKGLRAADSQHTVAGRKSLQAVFCIDVRSEVYRRALEAQSDRIDTLGFAGFFGMPLEVSSTARCPVLIEPGYRVTAAGPVSKAKDLAASAAAVWKRLSTSAAASFSAIEIGGLGFGLHMLRSLAARPPAASAPPLLQWDIPLEEKAQLAAAALKNMSLPPSRLAPVVLLCGHGSSSANNPYGSSLECGACGGHKGDINARFAAAILNDAEVRSALQARGMPIPPDTVFVGALHDTTTDEVSLFDSDTLLSPSQRAVISGWLREASKAARRERSGETSAGDRELEDQASRRSADWSEVRPEWGLAGNAAFIAAPRSRTRRLNLEGRAFLHEYDPAADHDGSVLNLILNAPVVVASWINLQYFASTVNNQVFGSGNKVLHNVVGTFGVWEGNGGDLRTGLPLQSLHDGEHWVHQPLRLHVVIEAPRERIDQVLRNSPHVSNLVENQWIHLFAIEEDLFYQCAGAGRWTSLHNPMSRSLVQ